MITELKSIAEHDDFVRENKTAVVHFGFKWNSFDRTMQRTLIELLPEFAGKIVVGFVDVDNNETIELIRQINLVNVPTLAFYANGERQAITVGLKPMDEVRAQIQSLL